MPAMTINSPIVVFDAADLAATCERPVDERAATP